MTLAIPLTIMIKRHDFLLRRYHELLYALEVRLDNGRFDAAGNRSDTHSSKHRLVDHYLPAALV